MLYVCPASCDSRDAGSSCPLVSNLNDHRLHAQFCRTGSKGIGLVPRYVRNGDTNYVAYGRGHLCLLLLGGAGSLPKVPSSDFFQFASMERSHHVAGVCSFF